MKEANIANILVEPGDILSVDCDKAIPLRITNLGEARGQERTIHRQLTDEERRELIYCTLAYGKSPLWYRLLRVFILSCTKRLYPKHGTPDTNDSINS